MKKTGVIRRIDSLGRIVIPKEIRKLFDLGNGDLASIKIENERITLEKYRPLEFADKFLSSTASNLSAATGRSVFIFDKERCMAAFGVGSKDATSLPLSKALIKIMDENKTTTSNFVDGVQAIEMFEDETRTFYNQLATPIRKSDETIGLVVLADKTKDSPINSADISLALFAADLIAEQI